MRRTMAMMLFLVLAVAAFVGAGYSHFTGLTGVNGVFVGASGAEVQVASSTGQLYQVGTLVTATAAEINAGVDGLTATAAEINVLDGVTAGTITASAGVVVDASKQVNEWTVTGDLTVSDDATGGDAGARSVISGLVQVTLVPFATMTNGSTETTSYMDATPTGEWAEVDAGTNLALTKDTTVYRVGAESLKIAFTDVVDNDGVDCTIPAQDDLSGNESIGLWIYSDTAISSGDFDLTIDDSDGTDQVYTVPAVAAGIWTWVEIDISGCDANCDTADGIFILATTQGGTALAAANVYLDGVWKWDAADELALGVAAVQDGVRSILTQVKADAGTQAHDMAALTENTDFFTHYETGNDFVVQVTDQSTKSGFALVAYR